MYIFTLAILATRTRKAKVTLLIHSKIVSKNSSISPQIRQCSLQNCLHRCFAILDERRNSHLRTEVRHAPVSAPPGSRGQHHLKSQIVFAILGLHGKHPLLVSIVPPLLAATAADSVTACLMYCLAVSSTLVPPLVK
jgi:hypothetical protein